MKKIILSCIIFIMLLVPVAGAMETLQKNDTKINEPSYILNEEFTHTVLAEYGSLSTCPYCVTASGQLYSIYNSGDLDFNYVTLEKTS